MSGSFSNLTEIFQLILIFLANGGWVLFVIGMVYMLYRLYRVEISHQFVHSQEWIFLNIKVPKDNTVSTLAVESIFSQMHALFAGLTFAQTYIEGRIQLWYSLELVSMGGKISYIIRCPKGVRHVLEAAFYAHYPSAEITEVEDYMKNLHYDPDDTVCEMDIFGTEWKLDQDYVIPLKTYKDFEHPTAEDKIIDPLSGVFEALAKVEPHEFMGIQFLIQPINDDAWKPHADMVGKQLRGEEIPHERKLSDVLLAPFTILSHQTAFEAFKHGGHGHEQENKPRNNWMTMTEAEKDRVNLIERKAGKPGYKTKMRILYIAPKDKMDLSKRGALIGGFRPMGSIMTNKIKPDVGNAKTWTGVDYAFSPTLEKPYLDWLLRRKKRFIFRGYKDRDIHIGISPFILNVEELATLYHFPITTETRPMPAAIEQTLSKKAQPPVNLPVAEG